MYRGDSFQVVVDKAEQTLSVAIALRAKLRVSTPDGNDVWDARISMANNKKGNLWIVNFN